MKVTFTLAVTIFLFAAASAFARDPACSNHEGVSNLNPFGGRALQHIKKCVPLYCSGMNKAPGTPALLKSMDNSITEYHTAMVAYNDLVTNFQKVCKKLRKNFCQSCPDFEEFQRLFMSVELKGGELAQLEQGFLSKSGEVDKLVRDTEKDSACQGDIVAKIESSMGTKKGIYDRFVNTKCEP